MLASSSAKRTFLQRERVKHAGKHRNIENILASDVAGLHEHRVESNDDFRDVELADELELKYTVPDLFA